VEAERGRWETSHREAQALERAGGDLTRWRGAFELATAARSKGEVILEVYREHEKQAIGKEKTAADLRRQIDELRAQLQRYGEALENDLAGGRERVATRVKEALQYERQYTDSSTLLFSQVQAKPECAELLEEMRREEAQYTISNQPSTAAGRPDQTGSFKAL
jgi:serine/threonine-protein kinase